MNTLPYTLAELQVKKPADKVCAVKVFALVDMLSYILSKDQESLDTPGHLEARSLDNKFAATLAKINAKTIDGTVRDIEAKALVDKKTDTLLDVRVRIMPTY